MAIPKSIATYLTKQNLKGQTVTHKTVFTAYDVAQTLHIPLKEVVKTLVLKGDGKLYLAVMSASRRLDFKKAQKAAGVKSLSMVGEKQMENALKVKAGAMTAFGGYHGLPVLFDSALKSVSKPLFGAGSFTDSLRILVSKYLAAEKPTVAAISEAKPAPKTQPKSKAKPKKAKAKKASKKRKK